MHTDGTVLVQNNPAAVERLHGPQVVELNRAVVLRFDDRLFEGLARRSSDVERPHRQLRSRLTNALRRDDADGFAEFDELSGGMVSAVALGSNTVSAFTREHRSNL